MTNPLIAPPIILNQLGRTRDKERREPAKPVPTLLGALLAAIALAGGLAAPLVDTPR
jgi:hypothetical protein